MWGRRKRTERTLAEIRERMEALWENHKEIRGWTVDKLIRMERDLHEARAENAALLERLEALERAHWHDGIESNCTECREIWNK